MAAGHKTKAATNAGGHLIRTGQRRTSCGEHSHSHCELVRAGNAPEPHTVGVGFSLIFPASYPFQTEGIVGIFYGVLGK